ncbi:MAG: hypothetical protein KA886_10345 [Candidatus Cloacimonetes bacterium]|nr:hypothetical protein [Candidatus Cloacimonadota bacterium]HPM02144.1 ferritin family protein [Candidatus Cloacimonadota bacterium]
MSFYSKAMELKKVSEQYYHNLSNKCSQDQGVNNILNMLAEDEMKHYTLFKKLKEDERIEMIDSNLMLNVQNEINDMKKRSMEFTCFTDQIDLYKEALEIEKKHLSFYIQYYNQINVSDKVSLKKIIDEEYEHIKTLSFLIQMIEHPKFWVESAEFNLNEEEY